MWFTVTPLAGYTLTVTGLVFDERNEWLFGPTAFEVLTSADGVTNPIVSGTLAPMAAGFSRHSTALSLSSLSGPFEVRIVADGEPPPAGGTKR